MRRVSTPDDAVAVIGAGTAALVPELRRAADAVQVGGHLLMATFSLDGPEQCSGLPVQRYDTERLADELHPWFELVESFERVHRTPLGATQSFLHAVARRADRSTRSSEPNG